MKVLAELERGDRDVGERKQKGRGWEKPRAKMLTSHGPVSELSSWEEGTEE